MKQLVVRIGSALFPLLTSFALLGAGCTDSSSADDSMEEPTPGSPDAPGSPSLPVAGDLDKSFGKNGIFELSLGGAVANDIITQGDKLVVCATMPVDGKKVAMFMRFDENGVVDSSFGTNGTLTIGAGNGDASCKDLEPAAGELYALMHFDNVDLDYYVRISANGDAHDFALVGSTKHLTAIADGAVVFSIDSQDFAQAVTVSPNLQLSVSPSSIVAVSDTTRALLLPSHQRAVVAQNNGLSAYTTLMVEIPNSLYDMDTGHVNAGGPTHDTVNDAVLLPDGSVFAVGAADEGAQTVAIRWVVDQQITGTAEAHTVGSTSHANSVALDATGRPVVVGAASIEGKQQFMWTRYQPASLTLDADFHGGAMAAPDGDGELVGITELNGALYALGNFGVDSTVPRLALLKIVE